MDFTKQERFSPLNNSANILKSKTVAIVGLGGLGSHLSEQMTRLGIGNLILIDDDFIEESNLSRQNFFTHHDAKKMHFKVDVASESVKAINPEISVSSYNTRLTEENASTLLDEADLILDGTDNLLSRYIINDYAFKNNTPWIYASATASVATTINFIPGKTPCFRCVYGNESGAEISCDITGVIMPILTLVTSFQATEALKILLDKEPFLEEIRYDIWTREETNCPIDIFLKKDCTCQTKKENTLSKRLFLICSGTSIQVNTELNLSFSKDKFLQKDFSLTRENDMFIELQGSDNKRIVAFKNGKVIFHHFSKEQVLNLI